ncbi:YwqG family protein [Actinoallomurus spadix]|uniref:DUF1963 domain-containing protein n=1 Tax=Actinoallomurus spadix TaxID=79912 RepID=A0ABN0X373_9ACTN|nr:DUF1963 domain-containing protein [Actinoallomurus spadix]MCO5989445.1 YwqG family protein [Actinoallomurus spadix]
MDFRESLAEIEALCAEHVPGAAGPQLAAMALPGLMLDPVDDGHLATGRCRLGGPALLEPGTPWPECDGIPLSLLAVLDTDPLAGWLGDRLPCRPGLLNFFYLDPDLDYDDYRHIDLFEDARVWRVIPADPARAESVAAPAGARSFAATPLRASPIPTLPDQWDPAVDGLDFGPDRDLPPCLEVGEVCGAWTERYGDGLHRAFGWPSLLQGPLQAEGHVHLLQIDGFDRWTFGDAGVLYYTIPEDALRAGDFTRVVAEGQCC